MQTVTEVIRNDGNGNVSENYVAHGARPFDAGNTDPNWPGFVGGGRYDDEEREFRGFGTVWEAPIGESFPDPTDPNATGNSTVLRATSFYQEDFLRGAPAVADVYESPDGSSLLRVERRISWYGITRGDLGATALLEAQEYKRGCDLATGSQVEDPNSVACPLIDLEGSEYAQVSLPDSLPYAEFRSRFDDASNRDAKFAYLVLPIAERVALLDAANPAEVTDLLTTRWHDTRGNIQLDWHNGIAGDPSDDRITVTAYAEPGGEPGAPSNLISKPCASYVQSLEASVILEQTFFDYDGLPNCQVGRGDLTRRSSGIGADQVDAERAYPSPSYGLPTTVTEPRRSSEAPIATTLAYDSGKSFVTSLSRRTEPAPAGVVLTTQTIYDPPGAPKGLEIVYQTVDENGAVVTTTADEFGRVRQRSGPSPIGLTEDRTYGDHAGFNPALPRRVSRTYDGNGNQIVVRTFTDGAGRVIRTERDGLGPNDSPAVIVQSTAYDVTGRECFRSRPYFYSGSYQPVDCFASLPGEAAGTTIYYDGRGRVRFEIGPDGGVTETIRERLLTTAVDPEGRRIDTRVDGSGQPVEVTEWDASQAFTTRYRYDAAGRMRAVCNSQAASCPDVSCNQTTGCGVSQADLRNTTLLDYDSLGRKVQVRDPDHGPWSYTYTGAGRTQTRTNANGQTLSYAYDGLGRLQSESTGGAADTVYAYGDSVSPIPQNSLGRVVSVASPDSVYSYAYDSAGRATNAMLQIPGGPSFNRSMSFDWLDRITQTTYPDNEIVSESYDVMGSDSVSSNVRAYVSDVEHDASGRPTRIAMANGTVRQQSYYADSGYLAAIADSQGGSSPFLQRSYSYYRNGKIASVADAVEPSEQLLSLSYDGMGRLRSGTLGGVAFENGYDGLG